MYFIMCPCADCDDCPHGYPAIDDGGDEPCTDCQKGEHKGALRHSIKPMPEGFVLRVAGQCTYWLEVV